MLPRPLAILAILSLPFCAAVLALWVHTYGVTDLFVAMDGNNLSEVALTRGAVSIYWDQKPGAPEPAKPTRAYQHIRPRSGIPVNSALMLAAPDNGMDYHWNIAGLEWAVHHDASLSQVTHVVVLPCWLGIFLSGIAPFAWALRQVRRRQLPRYHCAACGYDLRATPTQCPECGQRARPIVLLRSQPRSQPTF